MFQKIYILIIIAFLTNINLYAQKFNAEILGGIAATQVSGDQLGGFDKVGFHFGAGVSTALNEKLSLAFRINYIQKGSRKPSDLEKGDPTYYLLRLNYIEVPILVRYQLQKNTSLNAGISTAFLFKTFEEDQDGELSLAPPFEKIDLSFFGGISYELGNHFTFEGNYYQSILPIRKSVDGISYRLNKGQYNSVITLAFVYHFKNLKS